MPKRASQIVARGVIVMGSRVFRGLVFVGLLIGVCWGSWAAPIYTFTTFAVPGAFDTVAFGINDAGQIVGYFSTTGRHGFLKDGATFTTIDVPAGANFTELHGINDAGQIVGVFRDATGQHGFLKDGATFTTIDDPAATGSTTPTGINDAGQIVGFFNSAAGGFAP